MLNIQKLPPIVEDLRNHSQEQLAELRTLLNAGVSTRPDPRRPGFFEIDGDCSVFYVFKYPNGSKLMLLGVWERDPVAELAVYACPAA
jgi:hypothetical protein